MAGLMIGLAGVAFYLINQTNRRIDQTNQSIGQTNQRIDRLEDTLIQRMNRLEDKIDRLIEQSHSLDIRVSRMEWLAEALAEFRREQTLLENSGSG